MRNIVVIICGLGLLLFSNCREDLDFDGVAANLSFSTDTLRLDTVYTQYNSETYAVKVYNHSSDDVLLNRIALSRGSESFFKINVDGMGGTVFEDVSLRANDSLYVFVEMAVGDFSEANRYEDRLLIQGQDSHEVILEAFIQPVQYYVPDAGQTTSVLQETVWDNSVGRFIAGTLEVPSDLIIEEGTKIFFFNDAELLIAPNANLEVNGSLQNPVLFRSQRNDARYDSLPDQWRGITLANNSNANINYAIVKGSQSGLNLTPNSTAVVINTKIFNSQNYGIFANEAVLNASNLAVNNANLAAIALVGGGDYTLNHVSIGNYFDLDAGPTWSLFVTNEWEGSTTDMNLTVGNSIFYGRAQNAIGLDQRVGSNFNVFFNSVLARNSNTVVLDVQNDARFTGNILTENPLFLNTEFSANNLQLNEESPARMQGNAAVANMFPLDLNGVDRTQNPTLGAYQE